MLAFLRNINGIIISIVLLSQKPLPALTLALNFETSLPTSPAVASSQLS